MITFWFWFNVARADSFPEILRVKVALLQLVHRADDSKPMAVDDPDRFQARELLRETAYRGAMLRVLQSPDPVPIAGGTPRTSLRYGFRQEGLDDSGTRMRRQILLEIHDAANRYRIADDELVAEVAKYILIHSPMARRFQTFAAARAQADLTTLLGDLRSPAGLNVVLAYLEGLRRSWEDTKSVAHYQTAVRALRRMTPGRDPEAIAGEASPRPVDDLNLFEPSRAIVTGLPGRACQNRLEIRRTRARTRGLRTWFSEWRAKWRRPAGP